MGSSTVLLHLVAGTLVGLLGKGLVPGARDRVPLWLTIVCGIGGAVLGAGLYRLVGGPGSARLDMTQAVVTVLVAATSVGLAAGVGGRRS
jgi:uncharacterized membrane protein YeaQ/YmgE (transglycosylase-associated protein family)